MYKYSSTIHLKSRIISGKKASTNRSSAYLVKLNAVQSRPKPILKINNWQFTNFANCVRGADANWCRHLANLNKHNVVFDSAPLAPLCEKMTSCTKLELRNVFHCCQRAPSNGISYRKFCEVCTRGLWK